MMITASYTKAQGVILEDAIQRDLTTARRAALLKILWHERYLTRAQLIARVGLQLGKDCFGASAWEDTFYRDIQVIKNAFKAAGYTLIYSRNKPQTGYYLEGQPALSPELQQILRGSAAEVDPRQIEIYKKLAPADRFRQGCSISDTARNVVAFAKRILTCRLQKQVRWRCSEHIGYDQASAGHRQFSQAGSGSLESCAC